jgi:hypothetical protein
LSGTPTRVADSTLAQLFGADFEAIIEGDEIFISTETGPPSADTCSTT